MNSEPITNPTANRRSIVLMVLVGTIAYFNSFAGVFLFDDGYTIVSNEKVNEIKLERLKLGRPLIGYINAINHLADGGNPRGYHLVNLIGHLLASLTLFGFVRRTLLLERWPVRVRATSRPIALAVATLWMVHPLQTASVTYIIQRCESMMGLFYLLTMYCFLRGATSTRPFFWHMASIASSLLSYACKEVIVSAPIVILVYDWVFLAPRPWQLIKRRGWYYLLLTAVITSAFLFWSGRLAIAGTSSFALGFDYPWFGPWEYLMTQTHVILYYLRLSFWPDSLCLDYQGWPVIRTWRDCWLQGSILSFALLFSLFAIWRRWWIGFAIFAFFAILGPTSSFMPIQDLIFDHRMYLSLAPLICLVAGIGWYIGTLLVDRCHLPARFMPPVGALLASGLVIALTAATILRNDDYHSRVGMWSDVIAKQPNGVRGVTEVAALIYRGETADEARILAKRAIEIDENYADARYYYGIMLFDRGELDEAAEHCNYASRLKPDAWIYPRQEGVCYMAGGRYVSAAGALRSALKNLPSDSLTKLLLAVAEAENGNTVEADAICTELRQSKDEIWNMAMNEARLCVYRDTPTMGQKRLAILYARGAVRVTDEKKIEPLDILAVAYSINGRFEEAQIAVKKAIALAQEKGDEKALKVLHFRLKRFENKETLRFGASR